MAGVCIDRLKWSLERDDEGHRTYAISWLIRTALEDGPHAALNAGGLPSIGSFWAFGGDTDIWAFCRPNAKVRPRDPRDGEKSLWWVVDQTFSTRPLNRCEDEGVEDPLLEPQGVRGSFGTRNIEATEGKDGNPLANSAGQPLKGAIVEFEESSPSVEISQNVAVLGLNEFMKFVKHVNDRALWGLPKRSILLSTITWERKLYGTCDFYFTRNFSFKILTKKDDDGNLVSGWDRYAPDHGTAALGRWTKDDEENDVWTKEEEKPPQRYKDLHDENTSVFLDGTGHPLFSDDPTTMNEKMADARAGIPGAALDAFKDARIEIAYYEEANMLELGIPTNMSYT